MGTAKEAYEIIKTRLSTGFWPPGMRLPSLADMAVECNVSRMTMWKAVRLLQEESLVHARERGAIVAGPPGIPHREHLQKGMFWEHLKAKIGQDALSGLFPANGFPPESKLALQYGVTRRTIKKVLTGLVQDNILHREGRRYRLVRRHTPAHVQGMVLITSGNLENKGVTIEPRTFQVIENFERECLRLRYAVQCLAFSDHAANGILEIAAAIKKAGPVAGYVVNCWNPWNEIYRRRWFDLLRLLIDSKVPVIVIDQVGDLSVPAAFFQCKQFKILRLAAIRAGEAIASALMGQGHNRIAYVTPFFSMGWSRNRHAGLCRFIEQYHPSAIVELHALEEIADSNDLFMAILNLDKKATLDLFGKHLSAEELKGYLARVGQLQQRSFLKQLPNSPTIKTFRKLTHFLRDLVNHTHDRRLYKILLETSLHCAGETAHDLYLQPFFKKILKTSTATAWVCSDDKTALSALAFLRKLGKKVPAEISIVGFENWSETYEQQLSTYDFNVGGIVRQALFMIVDSKMLASTAAVAEVDGYMVERRTTRKH